jgi:hypothetical protein
MNAYALPRLFQVLVSIGVVLISACASAPRSAMDRKPMTRAPMTDVPYALRTEQAALAMPPVAKLHSLSVPARHSTLLLGELPRLLGMISGYPPRYANATERAGIYAVWTELLTEARAAAIQEGQSESARYLLAELYRMGHNMAVSDAALAAQREIHACLERYPQSTGCHFSALRYHLSVAPMQLDRAERSLKVLREQFGGDFNEEVERGFVFLSVYRGEQQTALRRIDDFLAMFPQSAWLSHLQKVREALQRDELRIHVAQ